MPGRSQGKSKPDEIYSVQIFRNDKTGVAVLEIWEREGKRDRADGPTTIVRDAESGAVIEEAWTRNNKLHREDGPATLSRDPVTGKIKRSAWFINGQRVPTPRTAHQSEGRAKQAAKHEVT